MLNSHFRSWSNKQKMYSIIRTRLSPRLSTLMSPCICNRQLSLSPCKLVRQDENFTFDWEKVTWLLCTSDLLITMC